MRINLTDPIDHQRLKIQTGSSRTQQVPQVFDVVLKNALIQNPAAAIYASQETVKKDVKIKRDKEEKNRPFVETEEDSPEFLKKQLKTALKSLIECERWILGV